MNRFLGCAATAALILGGGSAALAAGFQVKEQSALAQGYAFAGATAAAEDVTYMYFNPAAIAFHPGFSAAGGVSVIIPNAEVSNGRARAGAAGGGAAYTGANDTNDVLAAVPSSAFSAQVNDYMYVGLGVSSPFGLVTEYEDDWIGRYHGTQSELLSINVSPTLALRPIPEIAIAGGVQVEYVRANLENAVDTASTRNAVNAALGGAIGGSAAAPGTADAMASVHGHDVAYGFTLGALIEPVKGTRIGVGFRSEIEHNVDLRSQFVPTNAAAATNLAAMGAARVLTGADATTSVAAPAQAHFGVAHEFNEQWAVMADAQFTNWSSFEEIRIDFEDNTSDNVTTEDWRDTWFFAVGGRYRANDHLTLRAGVAYDQGATPEDRRTPRIPDADRYWGSFGAEYKMGDMLSVTGSYTYVMVDDSTINLTATGDNALRGSFSADVEANVHILTVGGRIAF